MLKVRLCLGTNIAYYSVCMYKNMCQPILCVINQSRNMMWGVARNFFFANCWSNILFSRRKYEFILFYHLCRLYENKNNIRGTLWRKVFDGILIYLRTAAVNTWFFKQEGILVCKGDNLHFIQWYLLKKIKLKIIPYFSLNLSART